MENQSCFNDNIPHSDNDNDNDNDKPYNIILMLITGIKSQIDDALDMMKKDPSLCTDEVRAQLDNMVEEGYSVDPITDFLLEHDQ